MRDFLIKAAMTAGLALSITAPAMAEITEIDVIFITADADGDLVLNKAEVLAVAITQFRITDSNRNNQLEKNEVGELANDAEFSDNDADKSGSLSIEEVIQEKLADFDAADANKDGALSLDEVKAVYGVGK